MNYEDFKKAFAAEMIHRMGGPGMDIHEYPVHKVNQTLDALAFRRVGSNITPQIYLNHLYTDYRQGKDIGALAEEAEHFIKDSMSSLPEVPGLSHGYIEENLYLTVLNPEKNRAYLEEVPHEYLEDLAVVPRIRISEEASCAVQEWMLDQYGFSREEMFRAARANMEKQDYRLMSLNGLVGGFLMEEPEPGPADNIYVLTNRETVDGAAAILSEKAMKEAREKIGEDFFILPSSRHEVILVPRSSSLSVADMTEIVTHANRTVVEDKDLLSDHVYRYNSSKGTIKMIEPKEEAKKLDRGLPPVL